MAATTERVTTQPLSLTEELILMLLNEENGYFHQVPGWQLNCAVVGAVLAELSLMARIDTDLQSLFLVDRTETGDPALDPILKEIADEPGRHNAQYWIERLAHRAESVIDLTLDRLVDLKILEHHHGEFWTLAHTHWHADLYDTSQEETASEFIKTRISKVIFTDEIPDPRDIIIICLVNTCDVFRFIFQLDDEAEKRIELVCKMDLIGRSIADAVVENLAGPLLRRSHLSKQIPAVSLSRLLFNPHVRSGNVPALLGSLAEEYGTGVRDSSALCQTDDLRGRGRDEPLDAPARTHVPESQGLFRRLRESLWRLRSVAFPGRRRPLPPSQGHGAGVLAGETRRSAGQGLPVCAQLHGGLEGG